MWQALTDLSRHSTLDTPLSVFLPPTGQPDLGQAWIPFSRQKENSHPLPEVHLLFVYFLRLPQIEKVRLWGGGEAGGADG